MSIKLWSCFAENIIIEMILRKKNIQAHWEVVSSPPMSTNPLNHRTHNTHSHTHAHVCTHARARSQESLCHYGLDLPSCENLVRLPALSLTLTLSVKYIWLVLGLLPIYAHCTPHTNYLGCNNNKRLDSENGFWFKRCKYVESNQIKVFHLKCIDTCIEMYLLEREMPPLQHWWVQSHGKWQQETHCMLPSWTEPFHIESNHNPTGSKRIESFHFKM